VKPPAPLQVQYRRKETERQAEARMASHAHVVGLMEAEPWSLYSVQAAGGERAEELLSRLCAADESPAGEGMSVAAYAHAVVPVREADADSGLAAEGGGELSRSHLHALPLEEAVRTVFAKGSEHTVRTDVVRSLCPPGATDERLLEVVRQFAVLVQGVWVAKSELRYPRGDAEGAALRLARDNLLHLLARSRSVRCEVAAAVACTPQQLRELMEPLATKTLKGHTQSWEFREPTDTEFLALHPELAAKQAELWTARAHHLHGLVKPMPPLPFTGVATIAPSAHAAVCRAAAELLEEAQLVSAARVVEKIGDAARSATPQELANVLKGTAVELNGVYVRPAVDDPTLDLMRNVVLRLLQERSSQRRTDMVEAIEQATGLTPTKAQLDKVTRELCVAKGSAWNLKTGAAA